MNADTERRVLTGKTLKGIRLPGLGTQTLHTSDMVQATECFFVLRVCERISKVTELLSLKL